MLETATNPWVEIAPDFKERRFPSEILSFTKVPASGGIPPCHFKQDGRYENWVTIVESTSDKPTVVADVMPSVFVSYNYIERIISGETWANIAEYLNKNQHVNYGGVKKDGLYRVSE